MSLVRAWLTQDSEACVSRLPCEKLLASHSRKSRESSLKINSERDWDGGIAILTRTKIAAARAGARVRVTQSIQMAGNKGA